MTEKRGRGRPKHDDILTPAEWRIVNAVRHGMTSREIAERRGVSIDAVKYHVANALQKLGMSRRAELRHWDGMARDSALAAVAAEREGQPMELGAIGQISRSVSDIEASRVWYGETLGLTHLYSFGDLAFFDCNGARLFLAQNEDNPTGESIIYFKVDDIHAACEQLKAKGVVFINAPHMVHRHENGVEEWMAFFNDPDERPLALMCQTGTNK